MLLPFSVCDTAAFSVGADSDTSCQAGRKLVCVSHSVFGSCKNLAAIFLDAAHTVTAQSMANMLGHLARVEVSEVRVAPRTNCRSNHLTPTE